MHGAFPDKELVREQGGRAAGRPSQMRDHTTRQIWPSRVASSVVSCCGRVIFSESVLLLSQKEAKAAGGSRGGRVARNSRSPCPRDGLRPCRSSISFQFLADSMQSSAFLLARFVLANKSQEVLTSHFSRDFSRDYHSLVLHFKGSAHPLAKPFISHSYT